MSQPILVVMAAGLGSRFGGAKQVEPVGENGELLLDYSVYDAKRAGFQRVIFIVNEATESIFHEKFGRRIGRHMSVAYVRQDLYDIPSGFTVPEGRKKPWGTGHAVLSCRNLVDAPFVVINADDYYGPHSFQLLYDAISEVEHSAHPARYLMAGYGLDKTLTENGHVARGICEIDQRGFLRSITERTFVVKRPDGIGWSEDNGETFCLLPDHCTVSMNCWCFSHTFLSELELQFPAFLEKALSNNPLGGEFFLPDAVRYLMQQGKAEVRVLQSPDQWYGVTYREDKESVVDAIRTMTKEGLYPSRLWD
jgi:dTDP-glucose pyrophosphorylase